MILAAGGARAESRYVFPFLEPEVRGGPTGESVWLYQRDDRGIGISNPFDLVGPIGNGPPANPRWNVHAVNVPVLWPDPPGWFPWFRGWASASPFGLGFVAMNPAVYSSGRRMTFVLNTLETGLTGCGEYDLNVEPNQPLYHPGRTPGWRPIAEVPPLGILDRLVLEATLRLVDETGGMECRPGFNYRAVVLGLHLHNTLDPTDKNLGLFYQLAVYDSRGPSEPGRIRKLPRADGYFLGEHVTAVYGTAPLAPGAALDVAFGLNVAPRLREAIASAPPDMDPNPGHYRPDSYYVSIITNGDAQIIAEVEGMDVWGAID